MSTDNSKDTCEEILKNIERRKVNRENEEVNIGWFCWLLSEYPGLIIFLCLCLSSTLLVVIIIFGELPDFSDPSKGFEVRGTELSDRLVTWSNMLNHTGYNSTLSNYPYAYLRRKALVGKPRKKSRKNRKRKKRIKRSFNKMWNFKTDGFTCPNSREGRIRLSYSRWVYQSNDESTLWDLETLHEMCRTEYQLLQHNDYPNVCLRQSLSACCPVRSLVSHISYIAGLESCSNLTQTALDSARGVLELCGPYYCSGKLQPGCNDIGGGIILNRYQTCTDVPANCTAAVYDTYHYLLQSSVCTNQSVDLNFTFSSSFLPAYTGQDMVELYYDNFNVPIKKNSFKISSIEFGISDLVFKDMLLTDSIYPAIAMLLLLIIVWIYTSSIFITIMHLIATLAAMIIAFFIYQFIFDVDFFPFLNLTSCLVMLGMATDNVLVLFTSWQASCADDQIYERTRLHPIGRRVGVVTKGMMRHVGWSLFVTGFTTSSAFFANAWSSVTAIKCFGIYTGLAVLSNLTLALTLLPAAILFHHKHLKFSLKKRSIFCCVSSCCAYIRETASEASRVFFHQIQVLIVVRFRVVWVVLYGSVAIASVYVVLVNPGFQLPSSASYLQFFEPTHPFEMYAKQQNEFDFSKDYGDYISLRFIFGVHPHDSGDPKDPDNKGKLQFSRFNVSSPHSQRWLLRFCTFLQSHKLYRPPDSDSFNSMCFIATLKKWMSSRSCQLSAPCCEKARFPYKPNIFELCLKEAISKLYVVPGHRLYPYSPGPRFDFNDVIRGVIIEFPTKQKLSSSQNEIASFLDEMRSSVQPELDHAPPGLMGGWFVGDFQLYALQTSLYAGTITSVGISLLVAQIVILATSRNVVVSIFVNLSIAGVIFSTVAVLALSKWELNVLESVTVSISVGLSVDFTAHYAIAYLLAPEKGDRLRRVETAIAKIGPAVATAAFTTFLAGLGLFPAGVLAYKRFGIFLMVIMAASWLYGSYFFLALLSMMGPEKRCGELRCRTRGRNEPDEHTTVITESSSVRPTLTDALVTQNTAQ